MTRVTGPLFSLTASGSIGDVITYSKWKGLAYVRTRVIPQNPKTDAQTSVRNTLTAGVSLWHTAACIAESSKTSWDFYASGTGMSGFNRYMKTFMDENTQYIAPWTVPDPT